jgi:hypothetical protein
MHRSRWTSITHLPRPASIPHFSADRKCEAVRPRSHRPLGGWVAGAVPRFATSVRTLARTSEESRRPAGERVPCAGVGPQQEIAQRGLAGQATAEYDRAPGSVRSAMLLPSEVDSCSVAVQSTSDRLGRVSRGAL